MGNNKVVVLMSTYNGEKFIREQIDSILHQKNVTVEIIIRDDCSTDSTIDILQEYSTKYNNITLIKGKENLKPAKSFFWLMENYSDSDYFALSDQDDVWDSDKLECAINMINQENNNIPLLYYSNLRIVDQNLTFYRNSHSSPHISRNKYAAFIENLATGCTIVYNRRMAQLIKQKKPCNFSMHDAWLYLVGAVFGKNIYDYEPHICYRQHENNVIGTRLKKSSWSAYIAREFNRFTNRNLQPRYDNAVEFLREFGTELSENDLKKVLEVVNYKRTRKTRNLLMNDQDIIPKDRFNRFRIRTLIRLGIV